MNEEFLQFIWKHRLFREDALRFASGDTVSVIDTGIHNSDSGPDFLNARLRFDCCTWAGNVEIHKNASDWYRHHHDQDKAYDNVILHLVHNNDVVTKRTNGEETPTLVLEYDKELESNYSQLLESRKWISCQDSIAGIDLLTQMQWYTHLAINRIQRKTEYFGQLLARNTNNWEETFYQALARSFGMNVNSLPFELMTQSMPLHILSKHRENLMQIEALLFGQSGMLTEPDGDEYYCLLKKEYDFLRHKYSLEPIESHLWKFLRLRPNNFPTLRIAQLASMIHRTEFLFSGLVENISKKNITTILSVDASEYWDTHYTFNKKQTRGVRKSFSDTALDLVLINTIIPFLFVYSNQKGIPSLKDQAISLLEEIDPEDNAIIRKFRSISIHARNALESQALIELKNEFCATRSCLECRIGNRLIVKKS